MSIRTRLNDLQLGCQSFFQGTGHLVQSWSQHNEDVLAYTALGSLSTGFYVDIGAYHPTRFSNTKLFHAKGWRGCNIEPDPFRLTAFAKERPNDINLNAGVSDQPGHLLLYELDPDTESTFLPERINGRPIKRKTLVPVVTLASILSGLPSVDFCSIDAEGMDLAVLQGNDWKQYRPRLICVEITQHAPEIRDLLQSAGYRHLADTVLNTLWQDGIT